MKKLSSENCYLVSDSVKSQSFYNYISKTYEIQQFENTGYGIERVYYQKYALDDADRIELNVVTKVAKFFYF